MAYIVPLVLDCDNEFCRTGNGGKRGKATIQVFNRWNENLGRFCKKCGEERLKRQNKAEEKK